MSQRPSKFTDGAQDNSSVEGNRKLLEDVAEGFRRLRGDESYDGEGVRTVWHQSKLRTEMLSWENEKGDIERQELSFCGMVAEFRAGKPVRTGKVPEGDSGVTTDTGQPRSHLVKMDAIISHQTLDYASHLLKHVPGRDFYAQHLLKQVNDTLNRLGFDEGRTVVSHLNSYTKSQKKLKQKTQKMQATAPAKSNRWIVTGLLVISAVLLGLGAGLLLW